MSEWKPIDFGQDPEWVTRQPWYRQIVWLRAGAQEATRHLSRGADRRRVKREQRKAEERAKREFDRRLPPPPQPSREG